MKRERRRWRKVMEWSLAVLTASLSLVWVGSAWGHAEVHLFPTAVIGIGRGSLVIAWDEPWSLFPDTSPTMGTGLHEFSCLTWFSWERAFWPGTTTEFNITRTPLWVLAMLAGGGAIAFWYRDRPVTLGRCSTCRYDLRGTDHAVCPECGTAVAKPRAS